MSRSVDEIQDELNNAREYRQTMIEAGDEYEVGMVRTEIDALVQQLIGAQIERPFTEHENLYGDN